jgi:hypothetical protein
MFPFSVTYTNKFTEPIEKEDIINQLTQYVEKNKGQDLVIKHDSLSFSVSLMSSWSFSKFIFIEKGVFILSDYTISFKFYMYRLLIIAALMSILATIQTQELWLGLFFFTVIGLGNWGYALLRYNRMLNDITASINKSIESKEIGSKKRFG